MDLRLIETFVEAARRQSFSGAAKALEISPAAVSQNVKSLEDQLRARLFTRTTRSVKLTAEGARYFQRIEPALHALNSAAGALAEERDDMRGLVRVSSTTAFGRAEVLPLLKTFMHLNPGVTVDLSLADQFVDLVSEGFDFAVRGGVLPENDYISRLLLPVTMMVVASPDYAAEHGLPKRIEEIAAHKCVGMRSNPSQRVLTWEFKQGKLPLKLDIEAYLVVNDPQAVALAAAHGLGLAQVGSNIALPLIRSGALITTLESYWITTRGLYAVYPTRRYLPKRVSGLINFLVESFSQRTDLTVSSKRS
jgi:LysR family transcriptional regulator, regulator for bpeEF and oprC